MNPETIEETIIRLERATLDRWCKGDPSGFIENAAADVTYFDHVTETRIDGIVALKEHLHQFVDKIDVPRYEMPNVKVGSYGDIAVLTCNWTTYSSEGEVTSRWNATEMYRRSADQWKYIHIHWAPNVAPA